MITFNNERTVERALRSLHWVDEIVVVDSFSTDGTVDIVTRYANRFEQRTWPGFRDQYQYASDLCRHEWRLFIDADEEISTRLATEMQAELRRNVARSSDACIAGYHGHRRTFYLGRWIMHGGWIPDHEIRLYHRDKGSWKGDLHAKVHVDGPEAEFEHFYYHYTYANISDQIQTVDRYTTTAAEDMARNGKSFSWFHLVGNPLLRFVKEYVLKGGFLDGMPGFIVAMNSVYYVFMKHGKLWEMERVKGSEPEPGSEP